MRAVSDAGPTEEGQAKTEAVENLFSLLKIMSKPETLAFFEDEYLNCRIRYGDLKKQLAEDIILFTSPIRERILEIRDDNEYLRKVTKMGAEKARESASKTIKEIREIIGISSF